MTTKTTFSRLAKQSVDIEALFRMANAGLYEKDLAKAETVLKQIIQKNPNCSDALLALAECNVILANDDKAVQYYQRVVNELPVNPVVNKSIADFYMSRGKLNSALKHLELVYKAEPKNRNNLHKMASCFFNTDRFAPAYKTLQIMQSVKTEPQLYHFMAMALSKMKVNGYSVDLEKELLTLLNQDAVHGEMLSNQCFSQLTAKHAISLENIEFDIKALAKDPLLNLYLRKITINILAFETWMVLVREALLKKFERNGHIDGFEMLATSIAIQNYFNEYVQETGEEEEALIVSLRDGLADRRNHQVIAVLSMYQPVTEIIEEFSAVEDRLEWEKDLYEVLVAQPQTEKTYAAELPSLSGISDSVSEKVRAQYEENPYPRWLSLPLTQPMSIPEFVAPRLKVELTPALTEKPLKSLIAGCGTGRQSFAYVKQFTDIDLTAIDISLASLGYAKRKSMEAGLTKIKYLHGDILDVGLLDDKFSIIECCGVLHHMRDPLEGWKALRGMLKEGGIMKISLYSKLARESINKVREYVKSNNIASDANSIRRTRQALFADEIGVPLDEVLRFKDLFYTSGCRDLFFHVQEHQMDIDWIENGLNSLDLVFAGFVFTDQSVLSRFKEVFTQPESEFKLSNWKKFEIDNPLTFENMYNFWCKEA